MLISTIFKIISSSTNDHVIFHMLTTLDLLLKGQSLILKFVNFSDYLYRFIV